MPYTPVFQLPTTQLDKLLGERLIDKSVGGHKIIDRSITNAHLLLDWKPWTPTYTNLTIGNGVVTARYVRIDRLVVALFDFILGSTSSVGTNPLVSAPVTAAAIYGDGNQQVSGSCGLLDSGSIRYEGQVRMSNTTTFLVHAMDASATHLKHAAITATVPFTWTTSDGISFTAIFEAA